MKAYTADDVFMVGQMSLARLATIDLVAGEVRIVCQPHDARTEALFSWDLTRKRRMSSLY